jgi:hypothetical protein
MGRSRPVLSTVRTIACCSRMVSTRIVRSGPRRALVPPRSDCRNLESCHLWRRLYTPQLRSVLVVLDWPAGNRKAAPSDSRAAAHSNGSALPIRWPSRTLGLPDHFLLIRVHWRRDGTVSRRMGDRPAVRILLRRVRCDLYVAAFAHRSKERYLILIASCVTFALLLALSLALYRSGLNGVHGRPPAVREMKEFKNNELHAIP